MFDEPSKPKKKKRANATFRTKPKAKSAGSALGANHLPVDLHADTPKIRADMEAERRRKGFQRAAMILMGLSIVALGRAALNETLFQNPRFLLREIKVETSGILSELQIQNACGAHIGDNLLTVNLSNVREQVSQLPAILNANVKRDYDGKLTITATQRKPVAWVKCDAQGYQPKHPTRSLVVADDGTAIPLEVVLTELIDLPVIDDNTLPLVAAGRPITSPRFVACMKLLKAMQSRELQTGERLTQIKVPNKFALEATFASASKVIFTHDDLDPQLVRYDRFALEARQKGWRIDTLNLVAEHNVPATFRVTKSATATPVAIPVSAPLADATPASRAPIKSGSTRSTRKSSNH